MNQNRKKRNTNENFGDAHEEFTDEDSAYIFVYEPNLVTKNDKSDASIKSSCGLKPQNANRLKAPTFGWEELKNITSAELKRDKRSSLLHEVDYLKQLNRQKRKILTKTTDDKVIELAVFVDDDLYKFTKIETDKTGGDPIERIQNIVYAYLNAVSLVLCSCECTYAW